MTFLGELRVQSNPDSLFQITYFIDSIGARLHLAETMLCDTENAINAAARYAIDYGYGPENPGDIVIQVEALPDNDGDYLKIVITDWGTGLSSVEPNLTMMDRTECIAASTPGGANTLNLYKRIQRSQHNTTPATDGEELSAIETVSVVMTTGINLDDLLKLIIDKLVETIDAERGTLYLVDEAHGELYSKILLEDSSVLEEIRVKIGEGISGYVAQSGEVVNLLHAPSDPRFNATFDRATGFRTRTMLVAPMRNPQQKMIGVVQMLNKKDGPFTARDERLLIAMSSQAAISIENARLYSKEIEQRLIQQELDTAKGIQRSFLPSVLPQHPNWQVGAVWEPASNVAGDFYDVYPLSDGRWALLIADVCGKGVPAALFMALSTTVFRFGMNLNFSATALLEHANRSILSFNKDSRMFASVFVVYLDFNTGMIDYASGGHNPPLLYRAATKTCEYIKARGVIIGLLDDLTFEGKQTTLEDGDILVMYTDGISEAMTLDDQEFGLERMQDVIAQHADKTAPELVQLLIEAVREFSGERGAFDDETLVIVKRVKTQ
jgi:phosphoserine phosphatase RsbU/P